MWHSIGHALLWAFGLFIVFDWLYAGYTGVREFWLARVSKRWTQTQAEIESCKKRSTFGLLRGLPSGSRIRVQYRYFGGSGSATRYTWNKYMADGGFAGYAPGDSATVLVNPSNPAQSYLPSQVGYFGSLAYGAVGLAVAAFIAMMALRGGFR